MVIRCADLVALGFWQEALCCPSCHEDEADGAAPWMCDMRMDEFEFDVCCAIAQRENLLDRDALLRALRLLKRGRSDVSTEE